MATEPIEVRVGWGQAMLLGLGALFFAVVQMWLFCGILIGAGVVYLYVMFKIRALVRAARREVDRD